MKCSNPSYNAIKDNSIYGNSNISTGSAEI